MRIFTCARGVAAALIALAAAGCTPARKDDADALRRQADEAFLAGNFAQAANAYEKLADAAPADRPWALGQAGKARNGASDWDAAVKDFTDALASRPAPELVPALRFYRAIAHGGRFRYREALEDLRAVDAMPKALKDQAVKADELLYRLGVTELRSGDWNAGRRDLGRLVAENPQSPLADDGKDRLALRGVCILIGRAPGAQAADTLLKEARLKGVVALSIQAPKDVLVVTGSFKTPADAQVELERVRKIYPGAFVVP